MQGYCATLIKDRIIQLPWWMVNKAMKAHRPYYQSVKRARHSTCAVLLEEPEFMLHLSTTLPILVQHRMTTVFCKPQANGNTVQEDGHELTHCQVIQTISLLDLRKTWAGSKAVQLCNRMLFSGWQSPRKCTGLSKEWVQMSIPCHD